MTSAQSFGTITGLQNASIKYAAERVGCTPNDMAKFFIDGGEWDCKPGLELEELLVECWTEAIAD